MIMMCTSNNSKSIKCHASFVRQPLQSVLLLLLLICDLQPQPQRSQIPVVCSFSILTPSPQLLVHHKQQQYILYHDTILIPKLRRLDILVLRGQSSRREDVLFPDDDEDDGITAASTTAWNDSNGSNVQTTGTSSGNTKADLYSNDELMNLFQIHQSISTSVPDFTTASNSLSSAAIGAEEIRSDNIPSISSLQDLIVQTVKDIEQTTTGTTTTRPEEISTKSHKFHTSLTKDELLHKVSNIRAIISDVDGTLLGSGDHLLHPLTERAIQNAVEAAYSPLHPLQYFFPATGKTRIGAMNSLGSNIAKILQQCPGVFVQGLYCLDEKGKVIFEKKLSQIAIEQIEAFVTQLQQDTNITLLAYDGDAIYYNPNMPNVQQHLDDVSNKWGEPAPIPMVSTSLSSYGPSFHKLLLMGDDATVMNQKIRPPLETLVVSSLQCVVTQAIPTMLEVLPSGCSKAYGVQQVCDYYGIDVPAQTCTIGDAENDAEMIQMASVGIAVGNAIPSIQDMADIVMEDTSTDGAAGQAIELFGLGKILESME